ncbi:MAG: hypothetical protein KDD35_11940, partial [Bdellovibrionales bacterium]|nr:hypothetical protein [Bdellovibrionales bacterium]
MVSKLEEGAMENQPMNPVALDGIEFIEFSSADPRSLEALFYQTGFIKRAVHKEKKVTLFSQNE